MKSILIATTLLLSITFVSLAQSPQRTREQLLKINEEYDVALVRGDVSALDKIYAAEFVYTTPEGEVRNKQQQLALTRSGELKLDSGQSDDVSVRIYGNTAVMTGRFTGKGTFRDKAITINERYTAVWVKKQGHWWLVAEQGNFIKEGVGRTAEPSH